MNAKIIVAIVVIVLVAVTVYVFMKSTPAPTITGAIDNSAEISSVIGDQYSSLIQEELNKLSIEQTDFNTQIQDSMANDLSQFYY